MIAKSGDTPLIVASKDKVLGTIALKDVVKGGLRDPLSEKRTGDRDRSKPPRIHGRDFQVVWPVVGRKPRLVCSIIDRCTRKNSGKRALRLGW